MGVEIERKFLVAGDGWRDAVSYSTRIRQGYLNRAQENGERASVRVRVDDQGAWLNIKGRPSGLRRSEYEYSIPRADGEALLAGLALPALVEKTRHHVHYGAHVWEIDVFAGANAGLVVAEIELGAEDEAFARPDWLGREVSDDPRYLNTHLARRPFSEWGGGLGELPEIVVDVAAQCLKLYRDGALVVEYPVSTGRNGVGEVNGSGCTPRGRHRVRLRIGEGCPPGTVFRARRPTGECCDAALAAAEPQRDWILTRILWLTGCEPGRNRGGVVDTLRRFIYIHGCSDDTPLGVPLSHGCIRMRNADLIALFDQTPNGTPVVIRA